ncbi:hypothetical protein V9T40_004270 [Parthenolecanium corni]|uniref:Fibronectin type-III domain-containing protein n=1 Tax=Parthenolecanium corni TaxID=536013 RepID=A0AAN9TSC4_9HEMI
MTPPDPLSNRSNDMIFASEYDTAGLRPPWKNRTLLGTPTDRTNHTMWFTIEDLEPDTQYEARVFSKNRFGWSESSEPFRFRTRSSESNSDASNDILTG